jgi:arsenate reductase
MIQLYGIPNCDTVRRARAWLNEHGVSHHFHDYKKLGVPAAELERWIAALGWELLLNRKGNSWRQLDPASRAEVQDAASAACVMRAHASTIKRPVVVWDDGRISVGFDAQRWAEQLAAPSQPAG